MENVQTQTNSKTAFLNPFPFLFLLLLLAILSLSSMDVLGAERDIFCTEEQIKNFDESGVYSDTNIFYFLSDGIVYNVYSWYDDDIYYDDSDYIFSVDKNYMVVGHSDSNGTGFVDGYKPQISMYDYENACILKVNNNYNIKVKDKDDTYLTNSGIVTRTEYDYCKNDNYIKEGLCVTLRFTSKVLDFIVKNSIILIIITFNVIFLCIEIFKNSKGVVR